MTTVGIVSSSRAMDGGLIAIAEISDELSAAGILGSTRLIGGVAVLLHQQRLRLDLPLRATADADIGLTPFVLRNRLPLDRIEALGYSKVAGNRWERTTPAGVVASVDLLVPSYRSRARSNVRVGPFVTTEVPGLAEALRRPVVELDLHITHTDRTARHTRAAIPDAAATLALKAWARTVRTETRDAEDLWRCLEIAIADGVDADTIRNDPALPDILPILTREFTAEGPALVTVTSGLTHQAAAQVRTRVRALLARLGA